MHKYFEKQKCIIEKRQKSDFFLPRSQGKKGRTLPSFKGIQQLEICKWVAGRGGEITQEEPFFLPPGYI